LFDSKCDTIFSRSFATSKPADQNTLRQSMLINLLPDFLAVVESSDPAAAYLEYFEAHRAILEAYFENYVVGVDTPHFLEVVRSAVSAERSDLRTMLERTDVISLARMAEQETLEVLETDVDIDVVVMVGVGAANAGELVVRGKGVAFVCLEHFTGIQNPATRGLGLDPELIPMWLAHEIAHTIRYTSPSSRSEIRQCIVDQEGYYSYWETARRVRLKELLINEGLATHTSRHVSAGHAAWQYFGYARRQYSRIREMEPVIAGAALEDLERAGLGLRLRYLSDGLSEEARTVGGHILPERSGYFMGTRMAETAVSTNGISWAIRASADEIEELRGRAMASA
jgi:hypothetical protein